MIVENKPHPNNLFKAVYPNGESRIRNCTHVSLPSERRPVSNLLKSHIKPFTAKPEPDMSYREYKLRRNIGGGLLILLWVIAQIYFCIVEAW
jgi:hypothetical protein